MAISKVNTQVRFVFKKKVASLLLIYFVSLHRLTGPVQITDKQHKEASQYMYQLSDQIE